MKILVAFSGGKDSQAALIWSIKTFGLDQVEAVFCDTGWEHHLTYQHIDYVVKLTGVKLTVIRSKRYTDFVDLSVKKKRFPSTKARFCTQELKTKPMIDYILEHNQDLLIIQGIRRAESNDRSKMIHQCNYFKYYYTPYKTDKEGNKLFMSYRKKDVFKWKKEFSDEILRPCFEWSAIQTIEYIINNGQDPNPLYKMGMSRVGCMPCIMCRHSEIKNIALNTPEIIENIKEAEKLIGRTFFPPNYIPERYMKNRDAKTGKKIPFIQDVVDYVSDDINQIDMLPVLPGDSNRCMSIYNLCE